MLYVVVSMNDFDSAIGVDVNSWTFHPLNILNTAVVVH